MKIICILSLLVMAACRGTAPAALVPGSSNMQTTDGQTVSATYEEMRNSLRQLSRTPASEAVVKTSKGDSVHVSLSELGKGLKSALESKGMLSKRLVINRDGSVALFAPQVLFHGTKRFIQAQSEAQTAPAAYYAHGFSDNYDAFTTGTYEQLKLAYGAIANNGVVVFGGDSSQSNYGTIVNSNNSINESSTLLVESVTCLNR